MSWVCEYFAEGDVMGMGLGREGVGKVLEERKGGEEGRYGYV